MNKLEFSVQQLEKALQVSREFFDRPIDMMPDSWHVLETILYWAKQRSADVHEAEAVLISHLTESQIRSLVDYMRLYEGAEDCLKDVKIFAKKVNTNDN